MKKLTTEQIEALLCYCELDLDWRRIIHALPERQKEAFVYIYAEGRTEEDAAARMGCTQVHVGRLYRAALNAIGEKYYFSTSLENASRRVRI